MAQPDNLKSLKSLLFGGIPTGRDLTESALREILDETSDSPEYIRDNFSEIVELVQARAYELFLRAQQLAAKPAMSEFLSALPDPSSKDEVIDFLATRFATLDQLMLSLKQSRVARAGISFEYTLEEMFDKIEVSYTRQPRIDGKPDFVFPSVEHYRRHSVDCIVFTAKRTLRERWRQVTTEGARGSQFFLATIDPNVPQNGIREMNENKVQLVIPRKLKPIYNHAIDHPNVLSFEEFLKRHLLPSVERWRDSGAIT